MEYRTVDGLKFFVREEGQGPPLVLCHGWSMEHRTWERVSAHFAPRYRVVMPEMRGHGRSQCGPRVPFRRLAQDLVEVLTHLSLSEPPVLCGHSLGGDLVLQVALDWPELPRAIVVADAPGPGNRFTGPLAWAAVSTSVRALRALGVRQPQRVLSPFFARLFYGRAYRLSRPEALAAWRTQWASCNFDGVLDALRAQAWREDVSNRLPQIAVPTLVINGALDRLATVREAQRYASAIPGARLALIAGAGHMSLEEAPDEFCAELDRFLESLPASGRSVSASIAAGT